MSPDAASPGAEPPPPGTPVQSPPTSPVPWALLALVVVGVLGTAIGRQLEQWRRDHLDADLRVISRVRGFSLADQTGLCFHRSDLDGGVWVSNFIFTRCVGPCPMMTTRMAELQRDLPADIHLVSFSVEPEFDTPEVLSKYAAHYGAQAGRWSFVTGPKQAIFDVCAKDFLATVEEVPDQPDVRVLHSLWFFIVDPDGGIRGHYDGSDREALERLRKDAARLRQSLEPLGWLATANAVMNGLSALLLVAGFMLIKARKIDAHKACMLSAVVTSILFLVSYLTYHFNVGSVKFPGEGPVRTLYLGILLSHTVLAVGIVPPVILTLVRAFKGQFDRHRSIARWTLPLWVYVNLTGVIVYIMLYHAYPAA